VNQRKRYTINVIQFSAGINPRPTKIAEGASSVDKIFSLGGSPLLFTLRARQ
jgi:hypothetical protein